MATQVEKRRNNPNDSETLFDLKLDIVSMGNPAATIECPYNIDDTWENAVHTTLMILQTALKQRKRVKGLIYAYYLGELIAISKTPRTDWLSFIRNRQITNSTHYWNGCTRTYQIFQNDYDRIYRTQLISFNIIIRLTVRNYENLREFSQNLVTNGTS
jgi:hypothetical protein